MEIYHKSKVVTEHILDPNTGEVTSKDFTEIITKSNLKGGFSMVYKSYDDAIIEICKSQQDLQILVYIRRLFTYRNVEVGLSSTEIAKEFRTSKRNVTGLISKAIKATLLKRVRRGVYRLNPYMYLPYRSEGSLLQEEWNNLN